MRSVLFNGNGRHFEREQTWPERLKELIEEARIRIHEKYGHTPRFDPEELCMHKTGCRCGYCYTTEEIAELIESGDLSEELNDYRPRKGESIQQVMERCGIC